MASRLGRYFRDHDVTAEAELLALMEALGVHSEEQPALAADLERLVHQTFRALDDPQDRFVGDLFEHRPMTSLRDVEAQAPIVEYDPRARRRG